VLYFTVLNLPEGVLPLSKKRPFCGLILLFFCFGIIAGCSNIEITNPLKKTGPLPGKQIEIGKLTGFLQPLAIPSTTTPDTNRILNLFVQDGAYFLALRSTDNNTTDLMAFTDTNTILSPLTGFGENGVRTLKSKMILGVTRSTNSDIYFIRKGVHTYKNGNDIVSLDGKTTATQIALLPGETQAYLYGNDNFDMVTINDGACENIKPAFLKNRAAPFKGGLTYVQIEDDGTIYGGGRIVPNGLNIVASFTPNGKLLKEYGNLSKTAKDSIYNLISMAVLKDYVCVIDGLNFKMWTKDGKYVGEINNSTLLGGDLNAYKLTVVNNNTVGILGYARNHSTKLIDIFLFTLTFQATK
jgi:hypothetical protein